MNRTRCKYVCALGLACLTTLALTYVSVLLHLNFDEKGRCLSHIEEYDVAWAFIFFSSGSQLICVFSALILALNCMRTQDDENVTNEASSGGNVFPDEAQYFRDAVRHNKRFEAYFLVSGTLLSAFAAAALTIFATVKDKQRCLATPSLYWYCFWCAPGTFCCLYLLVLLLDCSAAVLPDFLKYLLAFMTRDRADADLNEDIPPSAYSSPLYDPPVLH